MNRFSVYLGKGSEMMQTHSQRLFGFLSTCLEQDYLGTSRLTQLLCSGGGITKYEGDVGKSTASKRPGVDSALAKACVNQLAVATLTMLDPDAQSLERCLQVVGKPLKEWYGEMSRSVRSVSGGSEWLMD
eukprot:3868880-Alexandrium_andersonii.AAC.1